MEIIQQLLAPFVLLPLMFVVGLQLTPGDFRQVLQSPRAVVGGTIGQLVLLPLMTWGIVTLFGVSPILAAGAVLLAATPGAGMSNVMAAISMANVALSVTLTAIASLLAVVTMPLMATLGLRFFGGDAVDVNVPLASLFTQLVLFLAIPIGLGMRVRYRYPEAAVRYISRANRFAVIAILILTPIGAIGNQALLPSGAEFLSALAAAIAWTCAAMPIGWGVGALLGLERNDRFTLLIEFSARNIAVASIVAISGLGRIDLTLFSGVYAIVGYPLTAGIVIWHRRRVGRASEAAQSG
jgi:BASS family bile acid:Na+ symporter